MIYPRITTLKGRAWDQGSQWQGDGGGKYSSPSLVPYANFILPCVDKIGLKLARERVSMHALRVPTILYIPGVQDVVKRGEKYAHVIELAMPSFLTLISANSESWSRQKRCKWRELLTHHVHTQEKGQSCSLRSSSPSYEVDFPACNVQNIPHLLPYLLMTHSPPSFQYLTSTGRVPQLPFLLYMDCLCQPCPASCKHSSVWLRFSPCGREGVNTGFLFIYVLVYSFPGMRKQLRGRGRGRDREGRPRKEAVVG